MRASLWGLRKDFKLTVVIAVAPDLTSIKILDILGPKALEALKQETSAVAPQFGTVDDISQIIAFLASDNSRWISGSPISASGGKWNI